MSDAVTDDHYKLVDAILIELGINPREKFIADFRRRPIAQLIADSAARAMANVIQERGELLANTRSGNEIAAENIKLRVECERLRQLNIVAVNSKLDAAERAEKAEAEIARLKESEKIFREHHDHHFRRATLAERDAADATARAEKAEADFAKERARVVLCDKTIRAIRAANVTDFGTTGDDAIERLIKAHFDATGAKTTGAPFDEALQEGVK